MGRFGFSRLISRSVGSLSVVVLLLLFLVPAALALEPPRPGELARLEKQGKLDEALKRAKALGNYKLDPALLQRALKKAQLTELGMPGGVLTPPSDWRGMPTKGTVKILALLIDFSEYAHYNTTDTINAKLFGSGADANDTPYESLHNFYARSSYNQLNVTGNVLGWYPGGYRSNISQTGAGREALIAQALNYYNAQGHDFSQYDNNGDGQIDYFVVVWTGPAGAWSSFWWGYQTSWWYTASPTLDGKTLAKYSWQWECRYNGDTTNGVYDQVVVMHETGHALGLPDYYDYKSKANGDTVGPDGGVGGLDMMDGNHADHNAFSKWILDWITPKVVTGAPQSVTLGASGTTKDALVVMPGASSGNPFNEFFVVQNRQRVGNDGHRVSNSNFDPPNDGLLIWHVDARLNAAQTDYAWNNSYTAHKLLRLMEADGLEQIETVANPWADAADYYTSGKTFTTTTTPNSKKYDGTASNVVVQSIPAASASMTFQAGVGGGGQTDVTPPVTTATGFDSAWHSSPVTITFSATDPAPNATGVSYTEYKLDSGAWTHGNSVTVPAPANVKITHTILYRSVDKAGNTETYKSGQVRIDTTTPLDTTKPVTTATSSIDLSLWHNHDVEVALSATDAGGSGVASITGSFNGGAPQVVSGSSAVATFRANSDHSNDGVNTLTYYATDIAGNKEAAKTVSVKIDTLGPTGAAKKLTVKRGKNMKLLFVVRDARSPQVTCVVKIKDRRGRTKWSANSKGYLDQLAADTWWYLKFRCKLKKGTYSIVVTGKDLAGNNQSKIGRAKLVVK